MCVLCDGAGVCLLRLCFRMHVDCCGRVVVVTVVCRCVSVCVCVVSVIVVVAVCEYVSKVCACCGGCLWCT